METFFPMPATLSQPPFTESAATLPTDADATPTRVFDCLALALARYPKPDALAHKLHGEWRTFSTAEVDRIAWALAWSLWEELHIRPGDRVASACENNQPEWNFLDLAIMRLGAVHVPIYPTLTAAEFRFILEDAGARAVFVSDARLARTMRSLAPGLPELSGGVWCFDPDADAPGAQPWTTLRDAGLAALDAQPANRRALEDLAAAVRPEDLATLIYTSGTTGEPKGVMLSHVNLISCAVNSAGLMGHGPADERALSFLPLCHVFERSAVNAYFLRGTSVYYAENLDKVGENFREVRPHFFTTVPRFLEKVYARILGKGAELRGPRRRIFGWALTLAKRLDPEAPQTHSALDRLRLRLADRLVFSKWRAALGGRVRAAACGSAALNPALARVFWNAGVFIYEGYGPTEASPVISGNYQDPGKHRIGTCGLVVPGGEVRLAEDGEILYRGPNVMLGYWKRPDLTAETVDPEGFLHTGDIGAWETNEHGTRFLKITDRKKEMFKTSGGKFIAPQPIENRLKESPFIAQAMVVGQYHKFPGALIVPEFSALAKYFAQVEGVRLTTAEEVIAHPRTFTVLAEEVERLNGDFARYTQVKRFAVLANEWTIEGGELTPTMKLKRRVILERYAPEVESIYAGEE